MFKLTPLILCTLLFASNNIWAAALSTDKLVSISDSTKCMECHEDIADEIKTSSHSHSLVNLDVLTSIKRELNTPNVIKKEVFKSCVSCHAPQINNEPDETVNIIIALIDNSSDQKGNDNFEVAIKKLESINLNCRVCHMLKGMPEGRTRPKIIYGPGWDAHELSHMEEYGFDTLKSAYLGSVKFCTSCHREISTGSVSQFHILTHKKETLEKSVAAKKTCKDCHMSSGHSFKKQAE